MLTNNNVVTLLHVNNAEYLNKQFFQACDCKVNTLSFHDKQLLEHLNESFLIFFHYSTETARYLSSLMEIRKDFPEKPIIITTENRGEEILKWSLRSGICDCVVVPDELEYLQLKIKTLQCNIKDNSQLKSKLFYQFQQNPFGHTLSHKSGYPLSSNRLMPAINYIAKNYNNKLTTTKLATLCSMSESNFSLCFDKEMGQNFQTYLNILRINIAKDLLRCTNLKLEKIACKTGFKDVYYFILQFKTIENITPARYREQAIKFPKIIETTSSFKTILCP